LPPFAALNELLARTTSPSARLNGSSRVDAPRAYAGATMKRIRTLERELARKEKALAETAALLVLKKKLQALEVDEDVDTDEEHEP